MRNDNKNNSDFEIFKRLWGETKNYRGTFLISIILYLPVTLFMIAEPLVIGGAVQYGFVPKNLDKVLLWSSIYFGVVVAQSTLQMTQLYLMSTAGQGLVKNLRQKIFNKIQTLPMSYFDKTPMGKLLTRVTNDNESLTEVFTSGSVAVIGDSLFLVATLVMLITVDINLSAGVFIMLGFLVVGLVVF